MRSAKSRSLALLSLVFSVCATIAQGQSGRRPPQPSPTPTGPPREQTTDYPKSDPKLSRIKVLVGRQPTSRRLLTEDTIYAAFIQRLNEQKHVEATPIGDLKKRNQVVRRARAESEKYVVLLQLVIDNYQEGTIVLNSPDLEISYVVFAPVTGQEKYKDKVYFQAIGGARARKDAWPNGPPIKLTPEGAAFAAADGLYDWLLLKEGVRQR